MADAPPSPQPGKTASQHSLVMGIALRIAGATAVICASVFLLLYLLLQHQSQAALQATIDTDIAGLADIYRAEGKEGLAQRLGERLDLAPTQGEQPYYIVLDNRDQAIFGRREDWPGLDPAASEAGQVLMGDHRVLARVTQLRGGLKLMAGRSLHLSDQALGQARLLFAAALVLIAVAAFLVGGIAAHRLRQRVFGINTVFDALRDGDFRARTAVSRRHDEIDLLSGHVNQTLDRVERLIQAQRDVSDNIAHEVRTPLTALSHRLEEALGRIDDPQAVHSLEQAREQVRTTQRLLDALLDIASAQAQRGDLRALNDVDLSALARELCDLYEASAEEAGMTLTVEIEDGVTVRADAMQMSRLMVNLLDNALKYGRPGTALRFVLASGPVIMVEDDGPGIDDADKSRVFERYHRSRSNAQVKGHGLGLALVAAIAARHNLSVRVEDTRPGEVCKGARFIVAPDGGG